MRLPDPLIVGKHIEAEHYVPIDLETGEHIPDVVQANVQRQRLTVFVRDAKGDLVMRTNGSIDRYEALEVLNDLSKWSLVRRVIWRRFELVRAACPPPV